MRHLVVFPEVHIQKLLTGELKTDFRFFKKRPDFFDKIHIGDLVFFRKSKGDVLGQFEIGKLILVEKLEREDWKFIKQIGEQIGFDLNQEEFEEKEFANRVLLVIQITKLEQFITPPIEIEKRGKKEWVVLEPD